MIRDTYRESGTANPAAEFTDQSARMLRKHHRRTPRRENPQSTRRFEHCRLLCALTRGRCADQPLTDPRRSEARTRGCEDLKRRAVPSSPAPCSAMLCRARSSCAAERIRVRRPRPIFFSVGSAHAGAIIRQAAGDLDREIAPCNGLLYTFRDPYFILPALPPPSALPRHPAPPCPRHASLRLFKA